MSSTILCTTCFDFHTFSDELKRWADLGYINASHSEAILLNPGEFLVQTPVPDDTEGTVRVYFRKGNYAAVLFSGRSKLVSASANEGVSVSLGSNFPLYPFTAVVT